MECGVLVVVRGGRGLVGCEQKGIWMLMLRMRYGIVSESMPKLKVTGVVRDGKGGEMRILFFGEVAEKVVLMTVEECVVWVERGAVRGGVWIRFR